MKIKAELIAEEDWTEAHVLHAICGKHAGDIVIDHCKTGPSFGTSPLILDAWVMPRSWVKPFIGYEVKVDRRDFLRDKKWLGYTAYCHRFYFATPRGLILPSEVPDPAGLCWVTKNGHSLRIVKRAQRLRGAIPVEIFQYALMWRATVHPPVFKARAAEPVQQDLALQEIEP